MDKRIKDFNELKDKLKSLEQTVQAKENELQLLNNELQDVTAPAIAISETAMILLEMIGEIVQYAASKGWTEKAKASFDRLQKLMDLNRKLNGIGDQNYELKMGNRQFLSQIQMLRVENQDMKRKLENIISAENFE